jgi:hypothetical protein
MRSWQKKCRRKGKDRGLRRRNKRSLKSRVVGRKDMAKRKKTN